MPASKHMVVVEKRRDMQRAALLFGPVREPKPAAQGSSAESRQRHSRTRREKVSVSNDS